MQLTLQISLHPSKEDAAHLRATIVRFNQAADWLAGEAFELRSANKVKLQQVYYRDLRRRFGLSAQMAVRCIAQVCECYKRDKSIRPRFRKHAAVPYDQRLMSFKGVDRVSLLTLSGRVLVPIVMGAYQRERFTNSKGQSDLVLRKDGRWFLLVTVDVPDGIPIPSTDFIGVDLGLTNLATTSDGATFSGERVERVRRRHTKRRKLLQHEADTQRNAGRRPKNVRRALKRLGSKEARFRRHENHRISKQLVATAIDTERGLAVEDLSGIRERSRFRHDQRARLSGWAFFQLRVFLEYKARLAGVAVVAIDPRNTSCTCHACGHCEKANRKTQAEFECRACGLAMNADWNAALNLRARAAVNQPLSAEPHRSSVVAA
jgi:IS605 OrfB family transposase